MRALYLSASLAGWITVEPLAFIRRAATQQPLPNAHCTKFFGGRPLHLRRCCDWLGPFLSTVWFVFVEARSCSGGAAEISSQVQDQQSRGAAGGHQSTDPAVVLAGQRRTGQPNSLVETPLCRPCCRCLENELSFCVSGKPSVASRS